MNGRFTLVVALALAAAFLACATSPQAGRAEGSARATKERLGRAAEAFTERLRSALLREMQRGTVQAVSVCADSAQLITAMVAREFGVSIRRTSDRLRSPMNAPTPRDREILEQFNRRKSDGLKLQDQEIFEPEQAEGGDRWRLSRPILVSSAACLKCHGSADDISPETQAVLRARYPADRAQGYAVGDLRGLVVVSEITPGK